MQKSLAHPTLLSWIPITYPLCLYLILGGILECNLKPQGGCMLNRNSWQHIYSFCRIANKKNTLYNKVKFNFQSPSCSSKTYQGTTESPRHFVLAILIVTYYAKALEKTSVIIMMITSIILFLSSHFYLALKNLTNSIWWSD